MKQDQLNEEVMIIVYMMFENNENKMHQVFPDIHRPTNFSVKVSDVLTLNRLQAISNYHVDFTVPQLHTIALQPMSSTPERSGSRQAVVFRVPSQDENVGLPVKAFPL